MNPGWIVAPLSYSSPNAPSKGDVLGTWLLSGRAGHKRYAHITGLRSDALSPQVLGVNKIISEDALRRASARMSAEQSCGWLMPQLLGSVQAALNTPGYWTSTPPSKPCTANKKGPRSATTPTSPDAKATPCTPAGWAICVSYSMSLSVLVKSTAQPRQGLV